jgi:3-oxoacyl-[acyl-carrier protein] reductase
VTGPDPRSIAGRVAIVTGAASGMGRATARLFAEQGAAVAVCDVDGDGASAVADAITASGGRAIALGFDVADVAAVTAAVDRVRGELGPVDILVNNAGTVAAATLDADEYPAAWARSMDVNVTAMVHLVRACLVDLLRNGDGRIVNIASTEALGATPRNGPYTASKHAVVGFTRSLAVDLGRRGVTANAICPGPINTGMTSRIPQESKDTFVRRRVPLGRYGEPEEVAHVILSLVLPASSYLNGAVIPVDGGMTASSR